MKLTPPVIHFTTPEKYWDDATEGDVCISPTYEVTEARINAYEAMLKQDVAEQEKKFEIIIPPGPRLGTLVVEAQMESGIWTYSVLEVRIDGSKERIELLR